MKKKLKFFLCAASCLFGIVGSGLAVYQFFAYQEDFKSLGDIIYYVTKLELLTSEEYTIKIDGNTNPLDQITLNNKECSIHIEIIPKDFFNIKQKNNLQLIALNSSRIVKSITLELKENRGSFNLKFKEIEPNRIIYLIIFKLDKGNWFTPNISNEKHYHEMSLKLSELHYKLKEKSSFIATRKLIIE